MTGYVQSVHETKVKACVRASAQLMTQLAKKTNVRKRMWN